MLSLLFLLLLLLLLSMTGLVALVTAMYKDTYVKGDTTMSNAKGQVVGTRAATHDLPLLVARVLPDNELSSVETIRVTLPGSPLPGSPADPAEVGSGEATKEVIPGVVNTFRISRVEKVNLTAVVFHALGGEQVSVWNGVTTVCLSATGPEIPVCSADVTCAAFQVEGAELAEKYLAEAEALLAPFEEGRRRLSQDCRDPFRRIDDAHKHRLHMQERAEKICAPTNQHYCKRLAMKHGLKWIGKKSPSGKYKWPDDGNSGKFRKQYIYGCFADKNGDVRFVDGVDKEENMLYPFATGWQYQRLESLDFECLMLSNQARLDLQSENIKSVIKVLMLSNQARFDLQTEYIKSVINNMDEVQERLAAQGAEIERLVVQLGDILGETRQHGISALALTLEKVQQVYEFLWWDSCTVGSPDHCCQADNPISRSPDNMKWLLHEGYKTRKLQCSRHPGV